MRLPCVPLRVRACVCARTFMRVAVSVCASIRAWLCLGRASDTSMLFRCLLLQLSRNTYISILFRTDVCTLRHDLFSKSLQWCPSLTVCIVWAEESRHAGSSHSPARVVQVVTAAVSGPKWTSGITNFGFRWAHLRHAGHFLVDIFQESYHPLRLVCISKAAKII